MISILADTNTMKEHMNTVHKQKNEVKCEDCGEEFKKQYLLDKHKNKCSTNEVFEKPGRYLYQCRICNKRHRIAKELTKHYRENHKKVSYTSRGWEDLYEPVP